MQSKQLKAYHANKIKQLQRNVQLLQDEKKDIFARGKAKKEIDRLDDINHRLPYIRTEIDNLTNDKNGSIHGHQDIDRAELINRLRNREVGLTGGQMTRGTNFELKRFKNSDLKRFKIVKKQKFMVL